jgi:hypothetical protein
MEATITIVGSRDHALFGAMFQYPEKIRNTFPLRFRSRAEKPRFFIRFTIRSAQAVVRAKEITETVK